MSDERKLGQWLCNMRKAKKGTGGAATFYPSCEEVAKELGHPEMFNPVNREEKAIDMVREIAKFHECHGRYPSVKGSK